jgi:hypothetical protein
MVPRQKKTGTRVYCYATRQKLSFMFVQYTTIFQAEVYAIKACTVEELDRPCKTLKGTHLYPH